MSFIQKISSGCDATAQITHILLRFILKSVDVFFKKYLCCSMFFFVGTGD